MLLIAICGCLVCRHGDVRGDRLNDPLGSDIQLGIELVEAFEPDSAIAENRKPPALESRVPRMVLMVPHSRV
jgi:hypothetical protein